MKPDQPADLAIEAAIDAFLLDLANGKRPSVDRFCAVHKTAGNGLRERLSALEKMLAAAPKAAADAGSQVGEVLGDFRILNKLGEGGMGTVYVAEQVSLKRTVALKVIRNDRVGTGASAGRFRREAEVLAKLRHPSIVSVIAAGDANGVQYIAMELVIGKTLGAWFQESKKAGTTGSATTLSTTTLLQWCASIARALSVAHEVGVVHRDVKPTNILIERSGRALLSDFGLARLQDSESLTLSGSFRGTPYYAAPEQIDSTLVDRAIDGRVDVYALGTTLYEGLTGQVPFRGESLNEVFKKILRDEPVSPRKLCSTISRDLETVVLKAIERNPTRRYQTATAFAEDLEALLRLEPIRARPATVRDKTWKWIRRNRAQSAAMSVAVLTVLAAGGAAGYRAYSDAKNARERIQIDAETALSSAREALVKQRVVRSHVAEIKARLAVSSTKYTSSFMPDVEVAAMEKDEADLTQNRGQLTRLNIQIEEQLSLAGRFGDIAPLVQDAYAEYYVGRAQDSIAEGDEASADVFRLQVVVHDKNNKWSAELEGRGTLVLDGVPSDAEVFLFRYELQSRIKRGGEQRLVAVPYHPVRGLLYAKLDQTAKLNETTTIPKQVIYPGDVAVVIHELGDGSFKRAGLKAGDLVFAINGVPIETGLWVNEVVEGSPAAHAGIQLLDRITRIGDVDLTTSGNGWATSFNFAFDLTKRPKTDFVGLDGRTKSLPAEDGKGVTLPSIGYKFSTGRAVVIEPSQANGLTFNCWSRGRVVEVARLLNSAESRLIEETANPLLCSDENSLGKMPQPALSLPSGSYLCVVALKEGMPLRMPVVIKAHAESRVKATPPDATPGPLGFVWIAQGSFRAGGDAQSVGSLPPEDATLDGFWILDHEVTNEEYAQFLNDPAVRADITKEKANGRTIRIPRSPSRPNGTWREVNGKWEPASQSNAWSYPVAGLAYEDADAFVVWSNRHVQARNEPWTISLPTEHEWEKAARGVDARVYPWGNMFAWRYCNSPWLLAGGRTLLPIRQIARDESVWGVRDLAGSVREWCIPVHSSPNDGRITARGSTFNSSDPLTFRAAARLRSSPTTIDGGGGIRLVARPKQSR
ncbi:MAG: protein kinase domain-containing protein [Planctomycetota bacterium]